ncbi:MAG: hypothetical protein QXR30_04135 [Candidatus Woesearchaeota archaeon]
MENSWKKVIDNADLKVYEFSNGKEKKIVEARLENDKWHIIKKENDSVNEFLVDKNDFESMLKMIFEEKTVKNNVAKKHKKESNFIKFYRYFKDSNSEKWTISINNESYSNFLYLYVGDLIVVDVILHIKYKPIQKKIFDEIKVVLGIYNEDIEWNVYYYSYNDKFFEIKDIDVLEGWNDED